MTGELRMGKRWAAAAALLMGLLVAQPAGAASVERVTVESFDGVELGGWVIRPEGERKKAARLPAILISTPYIGQCVKTTAGPQGPCWPAPETPADWAEHPEPVEHLVDAGYAVGWFSVRGTGASGGCWDDMGRREQRDQKVLVDWLARQPWSNGRVGAMGLSAMSATALGAAVERPRALKTIVIAGVAGDLYTFLHSPQGLPWPFTHAVSEANYGADISLIAPGLLRPDPELAASGAARHHQRACPETVRLATSPSLGSLAGVRDADFWLDRRMTTRYGRIKASVLIAQGLQDLWQSGHKMQEDAMWSRIRAPKAMYVGQWGHVYPWQSGHHRADPREDLKGEWLTLLTGWLDHYLKGARKPRLVGRARFEDDSGTWYESDRWPPREARDETLYLVRGGKLAPAPAASPGGDAFRSVPQAERAGTPAATLCPSELDAAEGSTSLVYATAPVTERTVIAGNPMAYLDLNSDQPGGGFQVTLFDVGPDFACGATGGAPAGVRDLTLGGADLRFHHGGFAARPFAAGHVRVDIANLAAVLEPGHRLALTVSSGDPLEYTEVGHAPRLTVRSGPRADASQLVVPVLQGGFGGREPTVEFPARPAGG